jgi:hypothetical protein
MQAEHGHHLERNNILCAQRITHRPSANNEHLHGGTIDYRFVLAQLYVGSFSLLFLPPDLVNAINDTITIGVLLSLPYLIRTPCLPESSPTALPSAEGLWGLAPTLLGRTRYNDSALS